MSPFGPRALTNLVRSLVALSVLAALFTAEDNMTVMRRNNGWAFAAWVHDAERGRRQVWRGGYPTKRAAAAAERRFLVDAEDGANQPPDQPPPAAPQTLETFLMDWLEHSASTRRPTTSVSYDTLVRQHIAPHLGAITVVALAPADIRTWHATLLRKPKRWGGASLSPTTVRTVHRVLRRALQDALRWELIDRNPCDAVIAPRRAEVEMRVWDADQARAFLAHVNCDRLATMWRLFVATGMRRGEVAGLRWIDVDLANSRLAIRSTRVLVYSDVQVIEPKTRRSRRSVSLDAGTVAALHAHRTRQEVERRYAGEAWTETGYVFVRDDGRPVDPDRITHLFGVAIAACGLPRIRLHDLRHTAATLALTAGVHPKLVSERLGHSSIAITLDTYSHVLPSMQEDAAAKMGSLLDADASNH
jgi:integrase